MPVPFYMSDGWVKIHRQIKDHWLWKSKIRLVWWIDILLTVNHADSKILIKGKLLECKRGQSLRSLETWAKDWNVTKGAVRDFFKLLESDQMLYTENLQVTTRLTVCKYEDYQNGLHAEKTQNKRKTNAGETQGIPKQEGIKNNKEVLYKDFYELELSKTEDQNYHNFVKWLLGENENEQPFKKCLGLDNQIGYKQFCNLKGLQQKYGQKISQKIIDLENGFEKYKKTSLNLTLINWMKREAKK
jgi:hypothetical protein